MDLRLPILWASPPVSTAPPIPNILLDLCHNSRAAGSRVSYRIHLADRFAVGVYKQRNHQSPSESVLQVVFWYLRSPGAKGQMISCGQGEDTATAQIMAWDGLRSKMTEWFSPRFDFTPDFITLRDIANGFIGAYESYAKAHPAEVSTLPPTQKPTA